MARPTYIEIDCKSAINRVQGMPFRWSLNPYAGCVHACQYCFARSHYALADRGDASHDFQTKIYVKRNLPAVLERELRRPGWTGESIALGTSTDPYQPAEGRYRITRGVLEVLCRHGNPMSMVTKSPMVFRDVDLLAALAQRATVRVFFTVTTVDPALAALLEPGTAPPARRLDIMQRLAARGVPVGVLMAPLLPGINDSVEAIESVAAAAAAHGAAFFGANVLRLAPAVKAHYLSFLAERFPELVDRYQRAYHGAYAPRAYIDRVNARVQGIRERYGFAEDRERERPTAVAPVGAPAAQLALPI